MQVDSRILLQLNLVLLAVARPPAKEKEHNSDHCVLPDNKSRRLDYNLALAQHGD